MGGLVLNGDGRIEVYVLPDTDQILKHLTTRHLSPTGLGLVNIKTSVLEFDQYE